MTFYTSIYTPCTPWWQSKKKTDLWQFCKFIRI